MLHRLFQLPALLPGVAGSQLNLYPTAAFVHSAATLCTDLQVDLGQQLKLQHFVAALEPSDAAVVGPFSGVKYLQGEAFLLDEKGLNFTVKQVLGAWPRGAAVQLQHLHLREEAKLQNAYQLRCALHASEFLKLTKPLNLEVRTDKVYDWFRYVGYVRWAKHMMDHLQAATTATHFVDLGGGSGWLSMLVKAVIPVVQVVYTDISQAALEEAAASFRANGLMVETLQGDFFDPLQGRRIDFIFSYPPQVPPSNGGHGASRGSPEVALATPQGRSEAHFLRRFCRELVLDPQGVAWLGVTWELLQQTLEDCCVQGWNVTIPEAFRLDLAIPGTLLELRVASPNVGTAPCATRAAAQCAACPELLAVTSGATDDDVALQGARKIWSFLKEAPRDSKMNFLQLCIKESSSEGNSWWLDLGDREVLDALPVSASLSSLAVLRRVLEALWCDATAAEELGDSILSSCFTGLEASHPRAGWGFAYAAVLKRLWEVDAICQDRALALRSEMRLRMQDLCEKKKISEPLLAFTAALEAPVVCAAKVPKAALFKVDVSTGPLITEAAGGEESVAKNEEPVDDLDTGLVDLMEKFLRWSQSSDSAAQRSDALAAFAARAWTSVAGSSSGTTKMSQRMTRLALENLGITGGPVLSSPGKTLPVTPGVWRLIAVLCGHGQWPQNHWPALLQSLIKGNAWLSEHLGTVSVAFIDDAFEALSDLLHWAPVENSVESLATLLAASDKRLRSAAAKRLQAHVWVPARLGISSQPWSNNGMSASDALSQFEQLLQSDAPPEVDAGANGIAPSVGDVSYTVLDAVLGEEMTKTIWSVSDALESLATWEASADSESEGEDYHSHRGQRMREGYGSPPVMEGTTTPSSSSRCRKMPWMDDGDELPVETAKCCVASIAAWETLLKGIDRGVQEGASAGSSHEKPEESTPSPACLLAALLQLNPDQLAPDHAKVFPSQAAPQSQWSSPLQPLLRLLCHLLTSSRLAGFALDESDSSEALLSAALSQEPQNVSYDVLPLAARTLLLALRVAPCAVRSFWEHLPRRRDQTLVEKLISRSFTPLLIQAEVAAASALLEAEASRLPDIQTQVLRRPRQLLLQLSREDLRAELFIQLPVSFPLRPAQAEVPEKMPGIPKPRVRNWILQARQVLSGQRPMAVGQAVLMWAQSFALFFKGVEDCPICYNVIQLTTQTIPRKACPTCKHKFHNECLYQWFRTSSKTTCPLCNQPF